MCFPRRMAATNFAHGHDVIGAAGLRDQRLDLAKVNFDFFVVPGAGIGRERLPVLLALLGAQEPAGHLIGREEAGGRAQFLRHVADGLAFVDGDALQSGTGVFHHFADPAFDGEPAQQLEDHVLRRDPGRKLAHQIHAHDLRTRDVERLAGHCRGHFAPAEQV